MASPGRLHHPVAILLVLDFVVFVAVQVLRVLPVLTVLKGTHLGVDWLGQGFVCVQLYQVEANLVSEVAEPTYTPIFSPRTIFCSTSDFRCVL